jgi:Flp pilus assembly protein TadB
MPDLFDFFKENESKLHERPSEQTWQKLEKKLKRNRRPKRRGIRFLQLGLVAIALLLLLFAAVMVWYFLKKQRG